MEKILRSVLFVLVSGLACHQITAQASTNKRQVSVKTVSSTYTNAGWALEFNGSTDYVSAPVLATGTSNFTMECWVKWNGANSKEETIMSDGDPWAGGNGYAVFITHIYGTAADHVALVVGMTGGGSMVATTSATLPVGEWAHVALVYDGSGINTIYVNGTATYLNGTSYTTLGGPTPIDPSGNFLVGQNFNGAIDEVRVWKPAQDLSQIRTNMHLALAGTETGLLAYWQFNEGTGTTAHDLTSNANDGTLTNFAFSGGDGWVTSTAPVGEGTSTDTTNFTSGVADLGTVSLGTTAAFSNPVDLLATQIQSSPNVAPSTSGALLSDRYWILTAYGTPGTFSTNLVFTVPSWFTKNGSEDTSTYILYHRTDNSDQAWSALISGASAVSTSTITFNGITSFSQFMVGSSDVSLPVQASGFTAEVNSGSVILSWRTQSEINNAGFNILRQDPEATSYSLISSYLSNSALKGLGTSPTGKTYDFTDSKVSPGHVYHYKIQGVTVQGQTKDLTTLTVAVPDLPNQYALYQNYPNPFNPSTTINYQLPSSQLVLLRIYDCLGQQVRTLVNQVQTAGTHSVTFNGATLPSGVYLYKLDAGTYHDTKVFLLLK